MNKTRIGLALAAAVSVALACGAGHLIINVDVFSFMQGTGKDTISLPTIPATLVVSDSIPPLSVQLPPGLSNSVVDTVSLTGRMLMTNTTGRGTGFFQGLFARASPSAHRAPPAPPQSPRPTTTHAD